MPVAIRGEVRAIACRLYRLEVTRTMRPRIAGLVLAGSFALVFLAQSLLLFGSQLPGLFLLDETGYGDSYVLYDLRNFQNTGEIYRDLSQPPYLPALYSPLMYMLYSLPGRVVALENPFIGPRLIALTAFFLCISIVISIVRVLIPARHAWIWALLLTTSIVAFQQWGMWIVSARGDLPGIVFSLLTVRLLLARSRHAALFAGVSAGLAVQFKITLVAALGAGFLWLLFRRKWRELGAFTAAGTLSSLGLYFLFWAREPRMISQTTALSPGIMDLPGACRLTFRAIREPVALLSLLALPPTASRFSPRWALLFLFALISFAIASLAELQAGANMNYFLEALLALVPAAVLGILRLIHWARQRVGVAAFLSATLLFYFLPPIALDLYETLWTQPSYRQVKTSNGRFRQTQNALSGLHIFATVPRFALLDSAPELIEPYLMSYMQLLGKFDPQPILDRVRNKEFDMVITAPRSINWRGVPHIAPNLHRAIEEAYEPQCTMIGVLVHIPRGRPADGELMRALGKGGCAPLRGPTAAAGWSW